MKNFIKSVCFVLLAFMGNGLLAQTGTVPPATGPCTCDNIHPTFTYTTSGDCITTFVGATNITCADYSVLYEWVIDGTPSGSGQVFSIALGNGSHTVCLRVTVAINGQICKREWCRPLVIECDPCKCDNLIPEFIFNVDKCIGHFTGTPDIPCCIKEVKYDWYVNGIFQFTGQNFNYTFPNNGTYNVCLYISGTLPNGTECHKEICKWVDVKDCDECHCDQLIPNFTYDLKECVGNFNASFLIPPCMSDPTYEWTVNGIPSGTGPAMSYTFPSNGFYNVCLYVTATLPNGTVCKKEACKLIEVKDCDYCNCDNIQLIYDYWLEQCVGHFVGSATIPSCMQIVSWDWTVDGTPVGSGQVLDYVFPSNGVYEVCVYITTVRPDGTYCHKKFCKYIEVKDCEGCNCDQLQIDFNFELDKCNIYLYGSAFGIDCAQDYIYTWTVNGNYVGSGQNFVWTAPSNGTYVICMFVTVILDNGTECHKEICKTITVTDCDNCTCEGFQVGYVFDIGQCTGYFHGNWTLPPCTVSYQVDWYVNAVYQGSGPGFVYTFPASGAYQVCIVVTATLSNGTVCQERHCQWIEVNCPITGCNCEQLNGIINFQVQGCNIFLQAQPIFPACMSHPSYSWTVNGSFVGAGQNIVWTAPTNGVYTVCVVITVVKTNGQKCEKQICKTIVVNNCGIITTPTDPQGMAPPTDPTMGESISLYPNPASTELNIDFTTQDAGTVIISFKTPDGKEILNQVRDLEAGEQHLKMPISPLVSDEMIFVEIKAGGETFVRKVSVSRH